MTRSRRDHHAGHRRAVASASSTSSTSARPGLARRRSGRAWRPRRRRSPPVSAPPRNASTATSLAGVQPRRARSPVARPDRRGRGRERRTVGWLELEHRQLGPVDGAERCRQPGRVGEGVPDRQPHVGERQLCHHGPVDELDHGVHHRLRMDDHVDGVVRHAEELVGLDDLETLVHQGGGVHGDLRAHRPGRMGQCLVDPDIGELVGLPTAERSTRRRQQQAGHIRRAAPTVGTGGRRSARSRREELGARRVGGSAATTGAPAMMDSLLARARRLPGLQGGQRDGQSGEAHHAVDHHVGLGGDRRQAVGDRPGPRCRRGAGGASAPASDCVADGDHFGAEGTGLLHQIVDGALGAECHTRKRSGSWAR